MFLDENFLLDSDTAQFLYHEVAKKLPIIDYHTHLPPNDIATNRRFTNLTELWLQGDHYKWRAMRANGIPEELITGNADPYDKFLAWARTVPKTLRNPLHHWTHLELRRYFNISTLLDEKSAPAIWQQVNDFLQKIEFNVRYIFNLMDVEVVCTTDDPADGLEPHAEIAADSAWKTKVLPAFRPDKALSLASIEQWNLYVNRLAEVACTPCNDLDAFLDALLKRHEFFHARGCRTSDHSFPFCPFPIASDSQARDIFLRARLGQSIQPEEQTQFAAYLLREIARWNCKRGWVFQLHLGALRNTNTRLLQRLGADAGCDSIGDWHQAENLAAFLDSLDREGNLPKTILYNLNPADNYVFATMIGNFQDGSIAGKIQWGSAWWFLDQLEGMRWQINALSNLGLLSQFVGMLTDSRSFLSYPRHEYFRRLLCHILGKDVQNGLIPNDRHLLAELTRNLCYQNARNYFSFWD